MNSPIIYRPWQMPLFIKIFFWLFLSLPVLAALLPLFDMLSREQKDWPGIIVLLLMSLFCGFLYSLAVRYNRKISKTVVWLAEKMQMQAYVSRGLMPGFIFWPEVSGTFKNVFVAVKFIHYGRYRFTDLILPKSLVSENNLAALFAAKANQKLPKNTDMRQNETAYILRLPGCIVEKPVAESILLAFQILTQN